MTLIVENEPTYFQRLIDIPTELKEEDEHNKTGIGWDEIEPELPSDSYFIMIMPAKHGAYGEELPNMTDIESSNEISHSDSSASKNLSLLAPSSQPKRLFYWKSETGRNSSKSSKSKNSTDNLFKSEELRLPLIMTGSVANDCIEEAKSEDEEETEKVPTEVWSNGKNESTGDEDDLQYSMQDTNPNITNNRSYEVL